jgi:hypothetical protein
MSDREEIRRAVVMSMGGPARACQGRIQDQADGFCSGVKMKGTARRAHPHAPTGATVLCTHLHTFTPQVCLSVCLASGFKKRRLTQTHRFRRRKFATFPVFFSTRICEKRSSRRIFLPRILDRRFGQTSQLANLNFHKRLPDILTPAIQPTCSPTKHFLAQKKNKKAKVAIINIWPISKS